MQGEASRKSGCQCACTSNMTPTCSGARRNAMRPPTCERAALQQDGRPQGKGPRIPRCLRLPKCHTDLKLLTAAQGGRGRKSISDLLPSTSGTGSNGQNMTQRCRRWRSAAAPMASKQPPHCHPKVWKMVRHSAVHGGFSVFRHRAAAPHPILINATSLPDAMNGRLPPGARWESARNPQNRLARTGISPSEVHGACSGP